MPQIKSEFIKKMFTMGYQFDKNFIYFNFFNTKKLKFFFLGQDIIFFQKKNKSKKNHKIIFAKITMNLLDNHTGNLVSSFKIKGNICFLKIFTSLKSLHFILNKNKIFLVFNLSRYFKNFLLIKYLNKKFFFGLFLGPNDKFKKNKKFNLINKIFCSFLFIKTTAFSGKIWDFTSRRILHDIIFNENNTKSLFFFGFLIKKMGFEFYQLLNKKKKYLEFIHEKKKFHLQIKLKNKIFKYIWKNSLFGNIEKKKISKKNFHKPFSFIRIKLDLNCSGFDFWKKNFQESWAAFEPDYQDIDTSTNHEKWCSF